MPQKKEKPEKKKNVKKEAPKKSSPKKDVANHKLPIIKKKPAQAPPKKEKTALPQPPQPTEQPVAPQQNSKRTLYIALISISVVLLLSAASLWLFWQQLLKPSIPVSLDKDTPEQIETGFKPSTWFFDYAAMKKVVHLYNNVHPFIYSLRGGLTNDGELISLWSKTQRLERVKELRKLNPKLKIIPTIFRWENKNELIQEAIGMNARSDIRDHHIKVILNEIESYDYDGIDIDYEGMTCNKKEKFEEFIVLLSKELKKRNKILSVAVHPKTPIKGGKPKFKVCSGLKEKIKVDYRELWRGPMAHDYEFLARYADMVKVMAYELHPRKYVNPGPGPQAPSYWLEDIIEYAIDRVPAKKLYMAIPTYGYDWALNCSSSIKAVYWSDVLRLTRAGAVNKQPTNLTKIAQDEPNSASWYNLNKMLYIHKGKVYEDGSLWYTANGCQRVAFYMNRKAFEAKMTLLRRHDLAGFSFWQLLADNDPGINQYLQLLIEDKLPPVIKAPKHRPRQISPTAAIGDVDLVKEYSYKQGVKVDKVHVDIKPTRANKPAQNRSTDYKGVTVIGNE